MREAIGTNNAVVSGLLLSITNRLTSSVLGTRSNKLVDKAVCLDNHNSSVICLLVDQDLKTE